MKSRLLFLFTLLILLPLYAHAGGDDSAEPIVAWASDAPLRQEAVGMGAYEIGEVRSIALVPEANLGNEGIQTVAYRNREGAVLLNEKYYKELLVSKVYFNMDGTLRKSIHYIYGPDTRLVKTVHGDGAGNEQVIEE